MAITTTVTNVGRAKIISNGLLANARKIAFGTGYDSTPADATGLVTPYSPVKEFDIVAGHQNGAHIQVVFQEGETAPGANYSPTELVILDDADAVIAYAGVSTGSLFTKGTAPHMWTYIGELVNLPAGATINFTATVGYFVATETVKGVVELATSAEVGAAMDGTDPAAAIEKNVVTIQAMYDNRAKFGTPHVAQTAAPTSTQITNAEAGTVWLVYTA